jgi:hypothetical protein
MDYTSDLDRRIEMVSVLINSSVGRVNDAKDAKECKNNTPLDKMYVPEPNKVEFDGEYVKISTKWRTGSLMCGVCQGGEIITGNIFTCRGGHALCSTCDSQVGPKCPICRDTTPRTVNPAAMAVVRMFSSECTTDGCKTQVNSLDNSAEEHLKECRYRDIKCPVCDRATTLASLPLHLRADCDEKFQERTSLDSTLLKKGRYLVVSNEHLYQFLLVDTKCGDEKDKAVLTTMAIDTGSTGEVTPFVTFKVTTNTEIDPCIPKHLLTEEELKTTTRKFLPMIKSVALVNGSQSTKFPASGVDIVIDGDAKLECEGIISKYVVGNKVYQGLDKLGKWYECTIKEKKCKTTNGDADALLLTFIGFSSNSDEWVELTNGESDRIRGRYDGKTAQEESRALASMSEEERMELAMANSMRC